MQKQRRPQKPKNPNSAASGLFYVDEDAAGTMRAAVAFGEISMCNHSPQANADFVVDGAAQTVTLSARHALQPGDEILIDYEEFAEEII